MVLGFIGGILWYVQCSYIRNELYVVSVPFTYLSQEIVILWSYITTAILSTLLLLVLVLFCLLFKALVS